MSGLSARALAAAAVVAAIVGVVFPYVTLRLGFGPNVSLFATLTGFLVLPLVRARGRLALHAAHVAGVAAGQTAFMGTALAAFEILRARHALELDLRPSPAVVFVWLASAGSLGVLLALPLRRHYIDDEKLGFASGAAAAETILALEARGGDRRTLALAASCALSVLVTLLRPARLAAGPLGVGTGMLIGIRIAVSMAAGAIVARVLPFGVAPWAASALMVASGLTAAALRAPALVRALRSVRLAAPDGRARWSAGALALVVLALLCAVDRLALGVSVPLTLVSVAVAAPLLVVGTRVLGETNWAPVASLATVAQAALAVAAPGCVVVNMVGSVVAGAIPNGGQHMMQSLRAARIVGARTRDTAVAQLVGVVVGALALSVAYPAMVAGFGLGENGLASPFSVSWAAFAQAFAGGVGAVPHAARVTVAMAGAAGVLLALVERRFGGVAPSGAAIGVGVLVSPGMVACVLAGSVLARVARKVAPAASDAHAPMVASGLVAGEALAACAFAVLAR